MANFRRRYLIFFTKAAGRALDIFHRNVNAALRSTLFQAKCTKLDVALSLRPYVEILIEQWLHFRHLATRNLWVRLQSGEVADGLLRRCQAGSTAQSLRPF